MSIVGVGGVGKTRLAFQVGSELLPHYADGVWLCELAQVLDPDDLPDAVAAAVGYTPPQGVPVAEGLPRFLERKDLLLVLDNCEHLVGAVAVFVSATTAHAARVSMLATSREALGVRGEHISPLASLDVPDAADATSVLASEAGALFVARASEARGELRARRRQRAGGARPVPSSRRDPAWRSSWPRRRRRSMTPGEILTAPRPAVPALDRRSAAPAWNATRPCGPRSTGPTTCSPTTNARCSTGCRCASAASTSTPSVAIAAGIGADEFEAFELLASLVAKSLVERNERDGVTRYRLLEMIRQYAAEQLNASDAAETARDDHARHYLVLAVALFGGAVDRGGLRGARSARHRNRQHRGRPDGGCSPTERIAELVQFFDDVPFFDGFAVPVTTAPRAWRDRRRSRRTHRRARRCPGYPSRLLDRAGVHAFFDGDLRRGSATSPNSRERPAGGEPHCVDRMHVGDRRRLRTAIFELAVAVGTPCRRAGPPRR